MEKNNPLEGSEDDGVRSKLRGMGLRPKLSMIVEKEWTD